ncbi:unnamed protein product [Zymoseptoria tritici ST99CH_1A5]|uniref:Amidase domain-containing protein n=3 Tax=Zymoseptoria tritici TaxID=1047171 RepID=F9X184_ZYMTI|nr:uncharacterized protein MYCGRDRAFT_34668 [Zymoseptoria tritici IPO323]EGP92168.1 hypothetical protein MYCGRDRAFT_34668 [Zymoseptoria tritici IPO323]SMR42625.1 unnamed protein product [Zymoseptoria tritici ST99CH_1E4]SMR44799.1 unnamed protein product [Zymoseptoria tritici ST99CH_3D1]SMY19963.1 unnamed protein product [Zymoseptoria tritici ST99CH_1A5]
MSRLSLLASIVSSQQTGLFDPREATIASTHYALYTGQETCRGIVSSFLSRIEALNGHINAIVAISPHALRIADELDAALAAKNTTHGPLFCIPILLKDNFDTADMPTTGGNRALAASQPSVDALTVQALRNAGAIVLAKSNLHELALEGMSVSSLGGQTINPYDLTRTPGGSSGGTGAGIAASFAVWGTGSDTVNSLRSPASANGLFSCRPTRGLISRTGVMPNSFTQDAVGPTARCVEDMAVGLTVMASVGIDRSDNATTLVPAGILGTHYAANLDALSLGGLRFGLLESFFNHTSSAETDPVNRAMVDTAKTLQQAGAAVVSINDVYDAISIQATLDTQRFEFREGMDKYLSQSSLRGRHPGSLAELFSGEDFLVLPSQYDYVRMVLASSTSNTTEGGRPGYDVIKNGILNLTQDLHETFAKHNLDAIIYPEQKNLVVPLGSPNQSGRNGILAALTGFPVVTVPIGFSTATDTAPEGIPIGMEIMGLPWTEEKLLQIAFKMEELKAARRPPKWAKARVDVKQYGNVPRVVPDGGSIPLQYPVGKL